MTAGFGGSLIGRFANRIAKGSFEIDGVTYQTPTNIAPDGIPTLLHGGAAGIHDKVWAARPFVTDTRISRRRSCVRTHTTVR